MPVKTATRAEAREIEGDRFIDDLVPDSESAIMLRWIAERIVVRNQNGKRSDKLCLLCKEARRRREPCRHTHIWELTGVKPQHA